MTVLADLKRLPENERIDVIGRTVMPEVPSSAISPVIVSFIVESDAKANRYIGKLQRAFPGIRVFERRGGFAAGTIMVRVSGPLL